MVLFEELLAGEALTAVDEASQDHVGDNPEQEIESEEERDVDRAGEEVVGKCQQGRRAYDAGHCDALTHAQGKQLVMDVGLVGEEGIAT